MKNTVLNMRTYCNSQEASKLILIAKYNYSSQVKEDEMGSTSSMYGANNNEYWVSAGKPDRKRPLGRSRSR
jgi:hypothetical protein